MKIISTIIHENYFSPPQTWDARYAVPVDCAVVPDELDLTQFYAYNGFVFLHVEEVDGVPTVTSYEPNVEAWEEWKANLPPEPEPPKDVWDELADAIREGVNTV